MKSMDKIDNILQAFLNGNIHDARQWTKRLSKLEFLELIAAFVDYYGSFNGQVLSACGILAK